MYRNRKNEDYSDKYSEKGIGNQKKLLSLWRVPQ
jgi:hypothetical protein